MLKLTTDLQLRKYFYSFYNSPERNNTIKWS